MIRSRLRLGLFLSLLVAATASSARAQGRLEDAIKKPKPTRGDIATIEAEVNQRVKKLSEAAGDATRLADAKEKLTKPTKSKEASPAGLAALAQACAKALSPLVSDEDLDVGMAAVMILREMDDASCAEALAAAMRSPHQSIRLMGARSIQLLHKKLKGKKEACGVVLAALGQAGAAEKEPTVIRVIYDALKLDAGDDQADAVADAINQVLSGRVKVLNEGGRNEQLDLKGVEIAAACYARAAQPQRTALVRNLRDLLVHTVDHYFEPDIGSEQLPRISTTISRIETALMAMVKESKATPPSGKIADIIKAKSTDKVKQEKQAREALEGWMKVFRGEPWKID
jgi:hypothetical protein